MWPGRTGDVPHLVAGLPHGRRRLRAAGSSARRAGRAVYALRPTRERLRVARDLVAAGGTAALVQRARDKLLAPPPRRSRVAAPAFTHVQRIAAEPWPADLPLVTVVIPNYDSAAFLSECLTSLARQTTDRVEVLVVDSASTDPASVAALARLVKDPPIPFRVLRRPERHLLGCNRNAGWQAARGRYVCFLDPDDVLAPTYLEACLFHLEVQAYDIVGAGVQYFEGAGGTWEAMPLTATLEQALQRCPTSAPAVVRRELLEATGGFHDTGLKHRLIYEDWKLWVRALALGARLRNVPAELLEVRVHALGQSRQSGIPDMGVQRRAIAGFNDDVLSAAAVQRSDQLARTRFAVDGAPLSGPSPARPGAVLIVLDELAPGRPAGPAVTSAVAAWRTAGRRVVVVAETARSSRGTVWADLADLGTDDVHVLGQQLPGEEWIAYCRFLIAARGVGQVWRVLRAQPGGFMAQLPLELSDVLVSDLLADDFRQRVVV